MTRKLYLAAGATFNQLTSLEDAAGSQDMILWRCTCGTEKRIRATQVKCGVTKSCGCWRVQATADSNRSRATQRGISQHPLYDLWRGMIGRTSKPSHISYPRYGARGIKVCDRWRDAKTFYADIESLIGLRPDDMSLDRIDNEGGYEPGNVRWATSRLQALNRGSKEGRRRRMLARIATLEDQLAQVRERLRQLDAEPPAGQTPRDLADRAAR